MKLKTNTLIAIIRGVGEKDILPITETLLSKGIDWIEVSLSNQKEGLACIRKIASEFQDSIHLGVGTVTKHEQVDLSIDAGANYIITPGWDRELCHYIKKNKIDCLPGVFSPGEIMQASSEGFETVKLFPIGNLGASYVKSLRGPFPELDFLAVGGVTLDNIAQFRNSGCSSFAIGSELVPRGATKEDCLEIQNRAYAFQKSVSELR